MAEKLTRLGEIFGLTQDEQRYPGDYAENSVPLSGTSVCESNALRSPSPNSYAQPNP